MASKLIKDVEGGQGTLRPAQKESVLCFDNGALQTLSNFMQLIHVDWHETIETNIGTGSLLKLGSAPLPGVCPLQHKNKEHPLPSAACICVSFS